MNGIVNKPILPKEENDKKEEVNFLNQRFDIFKKEREKEIEEEKTHYKNSLGYQKVKKI